MPPIEQAKLWALREVLKEMGEAADQYLRMSRLVITAGGRNPDRKVVAKFFARVDRDPSSWYPGKKGDKIGRPKDMSKAGMRVISQSMMAAKWRKMEPSYDLACTVPRCNNQSTHRPSILSPSCQSYTYNTVL